MHHFLTNWVFLESVATLYDAENNVLMHFKARTHGRRDDGASYPWPDFGNGWLNVVAIAIVWCF